MARLDWRGNEVKRQVLENLEDAMTEIGLEVEAEAKKELYRGHGVVTGTLRRDIRMEGPERSGNQVKARVGAWVRYAMAVHQGHHSFEGYHFITNGLEKVRARMDGILAKFGISR